jgi:hypothetical protein
MGWHFPNGTAMISMVWKFRIFAASGAGDGDGAGVAVDVVLAGAGGGIDLDGEGLGGDDVAVGFDGGEDFVVGGEGESDAVGDVEVSGFAESLDAVDEFAGVAFLDEFGGEGGFEGDDERAAGGDGEAGLGGALDEDVGGVEGDGGSVEFDGDGLSVEERGELFGAEGGDGGDGHFHAGAELGAEGFVVGFGGEFGEGGFVAPEADFLDVEFVGDDVGEGAYEVEEGFVAADDVEGG